MSHSFNLARTTISPKSFNNLKILLIILLALPISVSAQEDDLHQFYKSDYQPAELNVDFSSRFDSIYAAYLVKKNITSDDNGSLKDFVLNYNYFLDQLNKSGEIFYNDEISIYLNELKDTLLYNHPLKNNITVYLTNFNELNAFTNDFGNVYVNVGLIAKMNSVDELLTVLAHEISHVILEHSYKKESKNLDLEKTGKDIDDVDDVIVFESHKFSRHQELEADSLAVALLRNSGFDLTSFESAFELLRHSRNPIYTDSPNLNLLFFGDLESITYFEGIQDVVDLQELNFAMDSAEIAAITDTLRRTHPTIDQRIENIKLLLDSTQVYTGFNYKKNFEAIKLLAAKIYLKKLADDGDFIEGIYLAIKLRELNPNDDFLIKIQLKQMLLLTQDKYKPRYSNQLINEFGDECDSENYLRFRWSMLQIPALEMNVITILAIKNATSTDPYLKRLEMLADQFLYKNNRFIFNTNVNGVSIKPGVDIEVNRILDLSQYFTIDDCVEQKKNKDIGYRYVHDVIASNYLLNYFLTSQFDENSFSEHVNQYKSRRNDFGQNLTLDQFILTINPKDFKKLQPKGDFVSATGYSDSAKIVIAQSHTFAVNYKDNSSELDILSTADYNDRIARILKEKNLFDDFQTNHVNSKSNLTVKENYTHYVLNKFIDDCWNLSDLTYSSVDEEIQEIIETQNLDYTALNINLIICDRNKNFSVHYSLYFDLRNMGVVYFSKVPNRYKPTNSILQTVFTASHQGRNKL